MPRARAPSLRSLLHLLVLRPFLGAIFGVTIRGRQHLEGLDRFILISNHNSHLDTPVIYAALPRAQILKTRPVAAFDHFSKSRLFGAVDFLFRPVWIDRTGVGGESFPKLQDALDEGSNLILFPEGTRGDPGVLQRFRGGIGRLVTANPGIPVVPIFLEGPERALPRSSGVPVPLWHHVTIAPPQRLEGPSEDVTNALWAMLATLGEAASEARRRRPARREPCFTAAVLGTDGSGKSTLATGLAHAFSTEERSCIVGDRLEVLEDGETRPMQPLMTEELRRWMSARAKSARSLKAYKLPKLAELLLRDHLLSVAERWYRPDSVFIDGMPVLNLCAWSVLYRPDALNESTCSKVLAIMTGAEGGPPSDDPIFEQFPEMRQLKRIRRDRLRLPDVVFFLDVPPRVCVERIATRGEARQVHETEEKLARLREAYLLVCSVLEQRWRLPVCILDGDRPREAVTAQALEFVRETRRRNDEQ